MPKTPRTPKRIETLTHADDRRLNIPTAEHQSVMRPSDAEPVRLRYPRNPDLDPQLVWRGKDRQDAGDLTVDAPPLYIQEKVHPKVLIDDLKRHTEERAQAADDQLDLFADFNGIEEGADRTEFYRHEQNWTNRMILGDSLMVMAGLAEREGLRGKVQTIYLDPPYGIKFNSNFQWSTTSRDVKDGNPAHITREPEQVKAFRDTWRDGIHSYLSYLRDRLTVARDLLTESGSIFVQIGDENVHRVRALMDEVFGEENFVSLVTFKKTHYLESDFASNIADYLVYYARDKDRLKFRRSWRPADIETVDYGKYTKAWDKTGDSVTIPADMRGQPAQLPLDWRPFRDDITMTQDGESSEEDKQWFFQGELYEPGMGRHWRTHKRGRRRVAVAGRIKPGRTRPFYIEGYDDSPSVDTQNIWTRDLAGAQGKVYVVQTNERVIQRCILMTTDPGDLVLDPTCGSGTTAYVAEQWGRRWITIDTSRVALALARARLMGARYPYYLLADSDEGQLKEAEVSGRAYVPKPTYGSLKHGFVYERVPHVTLKSIANNAEIDVLYQQHQPAVERALADLNAALRGHTEPFRVTTGGRAGQAVDFTAPEGKTAAMPSGEEAPVNVLLEWEVPRDPPDRWPAAAAEPLAAFWSARIARQKAIDASIAAHADVEYLYDKPYTDPKTVRVAGPFTVESLSPHRVLGVDEDDRLIDPFVVAEREPDYNPAPSFDTMILDELRRSGVQQAHKSDKITFTSLVGWPGRSLCAEGSFLEGEAPRRAGVFIGPEFGTVTRTDLVEAAREAGEAGFDIVIACAFNYDAQATEFQSLGSVRVLKARMNADLHMAEDLKNTGKGNLFVIFGEPDVGVASGRWLVTGSGRRVTFYELVAQLSGLGSLEEINGLGRDGLQARFGISRDPGASFGDWPDAQRSQAIAEIQTLTPADFPLSLSTDHWLMVTIRGVDVFDPSSGEVRSDNADGIATWFIDTDYNGESFFVRHAYFLGAGDPYKSLKTSLKAEIDQEAWATLNSAVSRPFPRPASGRIAVKVINHLGDEVMKVIRV